MLQEKLLETDCTISINLDKNIYQKIQNHALNTGEDISQCINSAISEAVSLWDDYDNIISTLNLKDNIPLF